MKKWKIISLTFILTAVLMLILSLFSPYNFIMDINPATILNEKGIKAEISKEDVQSVEYKGDHTYIIKTRNEDYVVVKDYYTFMNYKLKIYKLDKEWG